MNRDTQIQKPRITTLACLTIMALLATETPLRAAGRAGAPTPAPLALRATLVSAANDELIRADAGFWASLPASRVPVTPQGVVAPRLTRSAVSELLVQTAHNGRLYAFRIEWADPTRSDRIVVDSFGDQVAVELPMKFNKDAPPSPMMGNPGARVSILQWRAAFQSDLEHGEPSVRDLYPMAHVDVYPDEVLRATDARLYMGAVGLDNPISHPLRSPVLDQMAEGWGSLTVDPAQNAEGKGAWRRGRWQVVIAQPFGTGDGNDPLLGSGAESVVAFAVWEGGAREVGSRKAWSNWVPLRIE